jgi:Excalibur calcium-binding domain
VGQASNSTKILPAQNSEDLTHQDKVLIKLTPSETTAQADVSPKNIKIKAGTTIIWQNMLPEKVYVQSKPDENHYEGELLNGSYFFPGESRVEKLNKNGTFIYDGSNGFGSYYVRGTITVVENATVEKTAPIKKIDNQTQFMTNESYSNTKLGISLKHPTDWKAAYLKNGIQFIKEKNGVYVEIRKHNLESPHVELKQYVGDDIKDRSSSRQDFKLLNITNSTISGNLPAFKAIYTFAKTVNQKDFATEGAVNKISRTWTYVDGNAYSVAYVADKDNYDLYLPIAEKIIDTLKINPVSQQSFSDNHSNNNHKSSDSNNNHKSSDSKDKNDGGGGDKNCSDFNKKNFKTPPGDPDHLDADHDGIACEG